MNCKHLITHLSIALFIGAMLNACKGSTDINEKYFCDDNILYELPFENTSDTLVARPLIDASIDFGYSIYAVDSILCIGRMDPGKFELRSLAGDSLCTIGEFGQGPNDFTSTVSCSQLFHENGESGIWIVDVNSARLKRLNLTKSLTKGASVIDRSVPMDPMVANAFVVDGKIFEEYRVQNNYELHVLDSADFTILHKEPFYLVDIKDGKSFITYYNSMRISPDLKYVVSAPTSINAINILTLGDLSRKTISVGNVSNHENILDENGIPKRVYYGSISLSDKFIYALYADCPYIIAEDQLRPPSQIHIFDYDGNLVAVLPLDRYVYTITYSGIDNCIYAIVEDKGIVRYDLESVNQSIIPRYAL